MLHHDALSSISRSLVALIYQRRSLSSARNFAHQFFLSREVDLRKMLQFRDPKVALAETVAKFGREKPISRCASQQWVFYDFAALMSRSQVTQRNRSVLQFACLCCWGLLWCRATRGRVRKFVEDGRVPSMASLSTELSDPLTVHVIGCRRCASSTVLDEDTAGDGAASNADIPRHRRGYLHGGR